MPAAAEAGGYQKTLRANLLLGALSRGDFRKRGMQKSIDESVKLDCAEKLLPWDERSASSLRTAR